MSTGGRDLERALGVRLPPDVGQIEIFWRTRRSRRPESTRREVAVEERDGLAQRRGPDHLDTSDGGGLGRVVSRHEQHADAFPAAGQADGERAADGLDLTIEGELTDDGAFARPVLADDADGRQDAKRNREIERTAFLPQIGGRETHGDAFVRDVVSRVTDRRAYALTAFSDGGVRETDGRVDRQPARDVDLDADKSRLDSDDRRREHAREHAALSRLHAGTVNVASSIRGKVTRLMTRDATLRPVILVVDDEPNVRESFRLVLEDAYEVIDVPDGARALDAVRASPVDLVLLDIRLPEMDGIEVLERLKALDEGVEVILVTAVKTVRTAVAAMKLGAFDYVTKPFDEDELLSLVRRALQKRSLEREVTFLRGELARQHDREDIVGEHPEMQKLSRLITQVARTTTTVLITGESGTGKELIARAIHHRGPRRDKPFVPVNPAAIPESLVESELFGHEKGAFTGAHQRKLGRFELAQGGTLFLDEIGLLRPEVQAKLLRVLQEREIERVGGTHAIKIDVRIVAATNLDLKRAVASGAFREDLFYRLNVVPITVPPLRERIEDLPLLVDHFIRRYNHECNKRIEALTPDALAALASYMWPGNVRELQNIVERTVVLVDGPLISAADLPLDLTISPTRPGSTSDKRRVDLNEASDRFERLIVQRVLEEARGNVSEAARVLGLHRNSLKVKLARWKMSDADREDRGAQ